MAHATQQAEALEPMVLGCHVTFCGGAWKKTTVGDSLLYGQRESTTAWSWR